MIDWVSNFEKATQSLTSWAAVTLAAGFAWVVRRVFTNQKQIEMLQQEIKGREDLRQRDREDLQELKRDVKTLNKHVMDLHRDRT